MRRLVALFSTLIVVLAIGVIHAIPAAAAPTETVTIDFGSASDGQLITGTSSYTEDGFVLKWIGYGNYPTIVDLGGNKVLKDQYRDSLGSQVYIRAADGSSFTFGSLDYGNLVMGQSSHAIAVTAFPADGSAQHYLELTSSSTSVSTFAASALGVAGVPLSQIYVNIVSVSADYYVDNINLTKLPGKYYAGHYYSIVNTGSPISWTYARDAAAALDTFTVGSTVYYPHLATVSSQVEQDFTASLDGTATYLWLGASDTEVEGTWKWITGEAWSYTNWIPGEPNNLSGLEDYLEWNAGSWNDNTLLSRPIGYVVEYEPNSAPVIDSITSTSPKPLGASTDFIAAFTDDSPAHTATWNWGDGSAPSSGIVNEATGMITGSHLYENAGVYTVTLFVSDWGLTGSSTYEYAVVYDASVGFVTGGGWIYSYPGYDKANPSAEGKANFGFVSKYQRGASVPTGSTEFQFKAGDLNFKSTTYQWLVIAGYQAQFKGEGTVNGSGNYQFMITATDGDLFNSNVIVDSFRIKITDLSTGEVRYDNGRQSSLGGGSIVIHN